MPVLLQITRADGATARQTIPAAVWFDGRRTFDAVLDFGGRPITGIILDPGCRFPDRNPGDNVWPKPPTAASGAVDQATACVGTN